MNQEQPHGHTPENEPQPGQLHPAIYVASLADYNNGRLHGDWIDATIGVDAINQRVQHIIATSADPLAEEYAIHDYEDFGDKKLGESELIEDVARLAEGIQQYGPAFAAWVEYTGLEPGDWRYFEEAYLGHYDAIADYAEQIIDDLDWSHKIDKYIPESPRSYVKIDISAMAEDMRLSGDVYALNAPDGTWLFNNRIG